MNAVPNAGLRGWLIGGGVLALVVASFATLDLRWADFLAPRELAKIASFCASFFPPETSPAFLRKTAGAVAETFAMSLLGTLLAAVTGLALALPASAKGGVLAAIARERPVPVYFIGVGEKLEDLQTFNAREFAQALLE